MEPLLNSWKFCLRYFGKNKLLIIFRNIQTSSHVFDQIAIYFFQRLPFSYIWQVFNLITITNSSFKIANSFGLWFWIGFFLRDTYLKIMTWFDYYPSKLFYYFTTLLFLLSPMISLPTLNQYSKAKRSICVEQLLS